VDLDLQINLEDEALFTLGHNLFQLGIQVVSFGGGFGPVQGQDRCGNNFGLVAVGVDGVFAGSQGFSPDSPVTRSDQ